jgi:hypothetical protein
MDQIEWPCPLTVNRIVAPGGFSDAEAEIPGSTLELRVLIICFRSAVLVEFGQVDPWYRVDQEGFEHRVAWRPEPGGPGSTGRAAGARSSGLRDPPRPGMRRPWKRPGVSAG